MNLFLMDFKDDAGRLLDLAIRAQLRDHKVRYWMHDETPIGEGVVEKVNEWKPSMGWADLIVLSGNCDYPGGFAEHFGRGYPIFGTNPKAAELELDRAKGQEVLEQAGVMTLPYHVVRSAVEGARYIVEQGRPFAIKPWGGASDKSTTCTPKTVEDAVYLLERMEDQGVTGPLMLQEMVDGIEIGVSRFFGPGGWSLQIEESFEHKKFLNDDLGGNTGEMGTVIRHVKRSKLFDLVLEPLTDYLHSVRFVGDCNVNCIVDQDGIPWPLEFTLRLGWPDFCIRYEVLQGDPVQWMADLLAGRDTLQVSGETALGIVMTHGDFPQEKDPQSDWEGFPIRLDDGIDRHVHWQGMRDGDVPEIVSGRLTSSRGPVTAAQYVCVVSGSGPSVISAHNAAYAVAGGVKWPSNVMYRTDIGKRLERQIPELQRHGYALGMRYY